ncbi:MAG: hypothetical protein KBD06_01980 [Candidatus Pacebacteria bacterium]|nr:hypothetical protein [Candidatus Paceibacterota bacterium]
MISLRMERLAQEIHKRYPRNRPKKPAQRLAERARHKKLRKDEGPIMLHRMRNEPRTLNEAMAVAAGMVLGHQLGCRRMSEADVMRIIQRVT